MPGMLDKARLLSSAHLKSASEAGIAYVRVACQHAPASHNRSFLFAMGEKTAPEQFAHVRF